LHVYIFALPCLLAQKFKLKLESPSLGKIMLRRLLLASTAVLAASAISVSAFAVQLKIATVAPEGQYLKEMRAAGEAIKTQTAGRVEFKFFPGGVMGADSATVLRKIKLGQLQGGAFSAAELSSVSNDGALFGVPFIFASKAEFDFVLQKTLPVLQASYAKGGMVVPGFCGGGYAYLLSTKPLTSINDLKATKVWAPAGDPVAETGFKFTGASTVTLAIADVYPSLQTGLVETVGGPLPLIIGFQWHTKLKYMADVPLALTTGALAFDKRAFDKIAAADQVIVNTEVAKAFARNNVVNFDDAAARAALLKQGIQASKPTAEQLTAWQEIGTKSLAELTEKKAFSSEMLAAVLAARAEFRAK
jgi:TRAP-type transport system periplasmic protein